MIHQDWETVILRKKNNPTKEELKEIEKKKTAYNKFIKENEEIPKIKKTNVETRVFIQKARTKRGISQDKLAKLLCIQSNVIGKWESGKEPIPGSFICKLNKILNINIKKQEIH